MALHPFIKKMLDSASAANRPALSAGTPEQARDFVAATRSALGAGPEVGVVRDLTIPTRGGKVTARLYRTQSQDEPGLVVYFHGGGWVCGSIDDFEVLTRALTQKSGCAVLSVDYRLAPEHAFPAGLEDAEDAIVWAHENLVSLIGRPGRLVVSGDSAGANLATVAAADLQKRCEIALQCLFYPVTDSDFNRQSYLSHGMGLPLTKADMEWFFHHYADKAHWKRYDIAPIHNPELANSPPAWIAVAEYDVLHDEAVEYGEQLRKAGVPVTLELVKGLSHGFARLLNLLPEADEVLNKAAIAIRHSCTPNPAA